MSIDLETNTNLLAVQYQDTNLQNLLKGIGEIQQTYQVDVLSQYLDKFNIDTATGIWLDYIGYRIGVTGRPQISVVQTDVFGFDDSGGATFDEAPFASENEDTVGISDDYFRNFLKVKAQALITDCSSESIRNSLLLFFEQIAVIDNQDMTMNVLITTSIPLNIVQSVVDAGIIIRPCGVLLNVQIIVTNVFGFDGSDNTTFDEAPFVYIIEV